VITLKAISVSSPGRKRSIGDHHLGGQGDAKQHPAGGLYIFAGGMPTKAATPKENGTLELTAYDGASRLKSRHRRNQRELEPRTERRGGGEREGGQRKRAPVPLAMRASTRRTMENLLLPQPCCRQQTHRGPLPGWVLCLRRWEGTITRGRHIFVEVMDDQKQVVESEMRAFSSSLVCSRAGFDKGDG
jgi:hypothetical protein